MPILRADILVALRRNIVGSDDFDEYVLEILFVMLIAKLRESAFGEKFAGLNDADGVAELFHFGHDVRGENDGLASVAAFADELDDRARSHDIETTGGFVEDHDGWIMNEGAGNGGFLLHAGGELVAAAIAKAVHVEAVEDAVDAFFQGDFVEAIEPAKVLDHFLRGEAGVEGRSSGEEADVGADLFRLLDDIVTADDGGAVGRLEDGGEQAKRGGLASAVGTEEAVDFARMASKGDVIDGADFSAF